MEWKSGGKEGVEVDLERFLVFGKVFKGSEGRGDGMWGVVCSCFCWQVCGLFRVNEIFCCCLVTVGKGLLLGFEGYGAKGWIWCSVLDFDTEAERPIESVI